MFCNSFYYVLADLSGKHFTEGCTMYDECDKP